MQLYSDEQTVRDRGLRVVIPARYGSTRLPGKPLIDLAGSPMIVRVYRSVRAALPHADIVVATDDARVLEVLGAERIPGMLTDPHWESGTDRVAEVARRREWPADDLVINVQGDEPLLPAELLISFAEYCVTTPGISMATVAVPIRDHDELADPNVVKVVTRQDGTAITFSRALLPFDRDVSFAEWNLTDHRRHVGMYAYENRTLQTLTAAPVCTLERIERLEQLRAVWLGIPIHIVEWATVPPAGVDTPEDVTRVVSHLRRRT